MATDNIAKIDELRRTQENYARGTAEWADIRDQILALKADLDEEDLADDTYGAELRKSGAVVDPNAPDPTLIEEPSGQEAAPEPEPQADAIGAKGEPVVPIDNEAAAESVTPKSK